MAKESEEVLEENRITSAEGVEVRPAELPLQRKHGDPASEDGKGEQGKVGSGHDVSSWELVSMVAPGGSRGLPGD